MGSDIPFRGGYPDSRIMRPILPRNEAMGRLVCEVS